MLRKAAFLTVGNALTSLSFLLRSIIVAHLISVEDYGIATTFVMIMMMVEMASQFGLDRMIIQDPEGDTPELQSALQGFQFLRGLVGAALLLLLAAPFAEFMHAEEATWAYMCLAAVPVMTGLRHFDVYRFQRGMNYRPILLAELVPAIAAFLSAWPFCWLLGDWRAMLCVVLLQHVLTLLLSHLQARRPYRLSFAWKAFKRGAVFGLPLLVNGALLFLVFQGENMIVGRELGLERLSYFSLAVTFTLTPSLVLAKSAQALFLPRLSAVQGDPGGFRRMSYVTFEGSLVIAMALVAGVVLVGPPFVTIALGEKYAPTLTVLLWLGIVQALRVAKTGVAVISLAQAVNSNALIGNLPRVLGLPVAWWLVARDGGFGEILIVAAVAECIGFALAVCLLNAKVGIPLGPLVLPTTGAALTLALVALRGYLDPFELGLWGYLGWLDLPWMLCLLATVLGCVRLRRSIAMIIAEARS